MKKILIILFFLLFVGSADARSGCCSHHDGVMSSGCGCNDGTPLSSTCAPYYSCNVNTKPLETTPVKIYVVPTNMPTLTGIPRIIPTKLPIKIPTRIPIEKTTVILEVSPTATLRHTNTTKKKVKAISSVKIIPTQNIFSWFFSLFQ